MKLRFRFLAALLALIGLLTFSVQGAWAATCAATMEMESVSSSADPQAESCSTETDGLHAHDAQRPDGGAPGVPPCPAMPMGAAGACGAVLAVPSDVSPPLALSFAEAQLSPGTDRVREILLAGVFLRPPIA